MGRLSTTECTYLPTFSLLCHGPTINGGLSSVSVILNFCFVLGCKAEIFLRVLRSAHQGPPQMGRTPHCDTVSIHR